MSDENFPGAISIKSNINTNPLPGYIRYSAVDDEFQGFTSNLNPYNNSYWSTMSLSVASDSKLGGIKVGNNLGITSNGILNASANGVSRKFQKVLIVSQNANTGDYTSIHQCLDQFFGYDFTAGSISMGWSNSTGELAGLDRTAYPFPGSNAITGVTSRYIVLASPGTYTESNIGLKLPPYISLIGDGREETVLRINPASATPANNFIVGLNEGSEVRSLTIDLATSNVNGIVNNVTGLSPITNAILEDIRFTSVNNTSAQQNAISFIAASGVMCRDLIGEISLTAPAGGVAKFTAVNLNTCNDITLNNCGFSIGVTGSANTVVGLSAITSNVSGTNCQFLIEQTETAANNTVDIRAVSTLDSDVNLEYSKLSALGFDGLDANDDDVVQKSRAVYLSSEALSNQFTYTASVSEPLSFVHYDDKSQLDEIMAPLAAIDFASNGVSRGKYIQITSGDAAAQNTGYFKVANVITALVGAVNMSIIQLTLDYSLADQTLTSGSVTFKILNQVFLYADSLVSTNETIYYDTLYQPVSNFCIEAARCYTSGESMSIGNSLLILTQPQRLTVGAKDCDFLSLADACDSILDASQYKPYEILINPGIYYETRTINVPSYVSVSGSSQASSSGDCIIYFEASTTGAYSDNTAVSLGTVKSTLSGLNFQLKEGLNTGAPANIYGIRCNGVIGDSTSTNIVNCYVDITHNAGAQGAYNYYPIYFSEIDNVQLDNVSVSMVTDGTAINIFGVQSIGCTCLARDLTINITAPGSTDTYGIWADRSTMKVINPQITVSGSTGIVNGYYIIDSNNTEPYPSPVVSAYTNTLYGGQIVAYSSASVNVKAVNVYYNCIVIAYNTAFLGPVKSLNVAGNAAANSIMRSLNSYYLTRDSISGTITATGQLDNNGHESAGGVQHNLTLGDAGPAPGSNFAGFNNLVVGDANTAALYTDGSQSTILGIHAASNLVSGSNAVIIGFQSGNSVLDGDSVLIGSEAAKQATSSEMSVVMGRSAARDLQVTQQSVLLGANVMVEGLAANNTVAVGYGTASVIQSAESGIFMGTESATSMQTSTRDIIIGSNTLTSMLTGSDCVIVGTDAVSQLTDAVTSVFIGNQVAQQRTQVDESVFIGYQAGFGESAGMNNTGGHDIVIGSRAASGLTSGSDSVVIGTGVAPKMTTGSRNIIVGNEQMSGPASTAPAANLTSGSDDIIIGTASGTNLTTGNRVTIIGNESGQGLTNTNDVIILGYGSGNQLTGVRDKSIIIGNESGLVYNGNGAIIIGHGSATNATGDDICIIGNQAGRSVRGPRNTFIGNYTAGVSEAVFVLGSDNLLIGPNAGYQLTTGSYNVVFGSGVAGAAAGDSLETGNGNMLIGYQAGKSIIGGSFNVCLGYRAGYNLRNSDRNVIIGNDAAPNLADDNFNNLILGNEAGYNFFEGSNVVMIGNRAGYNSNTNLECLYIGNFAGFSNESGSQNSYLGNFAGQYASGSQNTGIGERSLQRVGAGANNIGIGNNAGRGALAGVNRPDRVIAIGNNAGRDISAGYDDILIGTEAGRSLGAGARSIMIGPYAGSECVNTSNSVFIGVSTSNGVGVGRVTSGQYNLFVGINVGIYNTTGNNNVFMGNQSGLQNTTGANNIAMGQNAGRDLTTGSGHILIGTKVGALDTAPGLGLSTGNNDIIIGYNAGSNCTSTISDVIIMGTNAGFNNGVDRSIFIGSQAGRDNSTGAGCIYVGPNAAKQSTVSGRNIVVGSNAASAFIDQRLDGQNIFIGDETATGLQYGIHNIGLGANALCEAGNVNSTIAIGFEAGKTIGTRAVPAGGDANRNIIMGYQSVSGGDINSDCILIGTQVAQHVDSALGFANNLFMGTRTGHNANLAVGSIAVGSANQDGTGGISNLMMGTGTGDNVGNDRAKKLTTSTNLQGGNTTVWVNCPFDQARYYFQEGDKIRIQNATSNLDTEIASLVDLAVLNNDPGNPVYTSNCMIVFTEPYLYSSVMIASGSEIYSLANLDSELVGSLDQSKASGNSLVGNDAGGKLTTGSKNVAFGTNALRNNKIGKYNNILGTDAGYNLISDNSTCIGTRAGYSLDLSNTLTYTSNTVGFDSNTNTVTLGGVDISEFEFGTVFDISGSTLNDGRYTVQQTEPVVGNVVIQGIPRLEALGIPLNVDSNDIRINSSTFNFVSDSTGGVGYGVSSDQSGNRLYTTDNSALSILADANIFQISGSKYNDGVYYKDTDPLEYSNSCVVFGAFNREIFDANVVISTNSINSVDSITSGTSFNDLTPTVRLYAYFGKNKGTYQTITDVSQYSAARPLNNCTLVDAAVDDSLAEDNIIFSHGYKQSLAINNAQYSDYYKFNKLQVFGTFSIYASNNTIYFNNPVTELDTGTSGYYRISGSAANNDVLVRLSDVTVDNQTFTYETVLGTVVDTVNITASNTSPVYFTRNLLCGLSRTVTDTFASGDLVSISNEHNFHTDIANGKYIVDAVDGTNIILAGDQVLPVMYSQLSNMQVYPFISTLVATINGTIDTVVVNEFSNVSSSFLSSNVSGQIQGSDIMFQSGTFTPGLDPYPASFTVDDSLKTITSSIRYVFSGLVAPCMVHIGGSVNIMALVVSNDFPFNKLVFRQTDSLAGVTGTEIITYNSVSSYNGHGDLSGMVAGTEYKVLNSTINNDITVVPSSASGAISRSSVFIDLAHPVGNYNTNDTVIALRASTNNGVAVENQFTPRGIFKRVDIDNSNLSLTYNSTDYLARYEPADKYTNPDLLTGTSVKVIDGTQFIFEPSVSHPGKYNLNTIGDNQAFTDVSTSNVTYWDGANTDISKMVSLPAGRTVDIYGESFSQFRLSQNGYMVFEGANVHTVKWLASDDDQFNIRPGVIGSNVNIKYINDGNSTNGADNVMLINYMTNNAIGWGKSGVNNAELRVYMDNTANVATESRIIVNYSDSTSNLGSPGQYQATKYAVRGLESTTNTYDRESRNADTLATLNESNTASYYLKGSDASYGVKAGLDGNVLVLTRTTTNGANLDTITDGVSGSQFGYSSSQHGTRFVVGAPGDSFTVTGNAYVYDNTGEYLGYLYTSNVTNPPAVYGKFGTSVAMWDNRIIVGAPSNLPSGNGSAHVFDWNGSNWINTANLVSSLSNANGFGTSCSIYNSNLVMIGAPKTENIMGVLVGSVHFFEWDGATWTENYNIAPDGLGNMGNSVAVWGNVAVAGSPTSNVGLGDFGNVYVYKQTTTPGGAWTNTQVLDGGDWSGRTAPGMFLTHSNFGFSLDMNSEWLLIGYPGYSLSGNPEVGGAYLYELNSSGNFVFDSEKITPNVQNSYDNFGKSVFMNYDSSTQTGYSVITENGNAFVYYTSPDTLLPWSYTNLSYTDPVAGFGISATIDFTGRVFIGDNTSNLGFINDTTKFGLMIDPVSNAAIIGVPGSNVQFGSAISISGSRLAIGGSSTSANGAVYLYSADNTNISSWTNTSNLTPSGLNANCNDIQFGYALDSTPEWLSVGAYQYSTPTALILDGIKSGNVYVYDNTATPPTLTQTIEPPTTPSYGNFGRSLSIEGNTIVIGAPGQPVSGSETGNVYIYDWNGASWSQNSNVLQAGGTSTQFGNVVKIRNNCIAVADTSNNVTTFGNVYVYKDGDWSGGSDRLIGSDVTFASYIYGYSLALTDKHLAVGTNMVNNGNVYIFQRVSQGFGTEVSPGVFNESTKIVNTEIGINGFGSQLSFNESQDMLAVGAYNSTASKNYIYLYKFNSGPKFTDGNNAWSLMQTVTVSDGSPASAPTGLLFNENSLLIGNAVINQVKAYYYTPENNRLYYTTIDTKPEPYFHTDWATHTALAGQSQSSNIASMGGGLRIHGELAGNVVISKNGYLYFNESPFVSMLEPLCGYPFNNAYYRQSANALTVTMTNTANTVIVQANMYLDNNRYGENMNIVYKTLSGLATVSNTYSALSHTIYNTVITEPFNNNSNAVGLVFNSPSVGEVSNIALLQTGDIVNLTGFNQFENNGLFEVLSNPLNVGVDYYMAVRNTGFTTEEYYKTGTNVTVNEFRSYLDVDGLGTPADIYFQDMRTITGNTSNFLRFAKLRLEGLDTVTGSVAGNANIMEKSLNFAISSWDNSNIQTDYAVYLRERVPRDYTATGNVFSNYIIALGTPIPDCGSNLQLEYQNINTGPVGYIHNYVYRGLATEGSIFSSNTYNLNGNISITGNTITLSGIDVASSGVIDLGRTDSRYDDPVTQPLQRVKPGMLLQITDNSAYTANIMVANVTVGSGGEYLTMARDTRYDSSNIDGAWNFTPGQLDIKFMDDSVLPLKYLSAQVISDRYNFAAVPYNSSGYNDATMYLAKLPISGITLIPSPISYRFHAPDYQMEPNLINQALDSIPEDDTNIIKCLPYGLNYLLNNKKLIEDNGNHTWLIPSTELTSSGYQNIIYIAEESYFSSLLDIDNSVPGAIVNTGSLAPPSFTSALRKGTIFKLDTATYGSCYYQVSLTQDPTANTIYLNTAFNPNASKISGVTDLGYIVCRGFGSLNTSLANLGYFQPGQKIIVSRSVFPDGSPVDGVYILDRNVPTSPEYISIGAGDGPVLDNGILRFCALEKCMFGDEEYPVQYPAGSNTAIGAGGQPLLNIPDGTSNLLATFTVGDTIQIYDTGLAGVDGTWTVSPNLAISAYSIPVDGGLTTGADITTAFNVTKDVTMRIIGKAISTTTDAGIVKFHYTDAQGNNLMLGSFTGQFAGASSLSIQNVFIGNKVGQTNQGSGNILIGNETGFALNAEDGATSYNNKFAVYKNNFIGVPSNPLLGGDFASGRVGVNTIDPDSLLTGALDTVTRMVVNGRVRAQAFNTFTGTHFVTITETPGVRLEPGMLMVSTGKVNKQSMLDTIVDCRVSSQANDKRVYGVYSNCERIDNEGRMVHQVASLGEGQILICNIGGDLENGDYISSSPIPGLGQRQADDIVRSYTVAKVTESVDWSSIHEYVWFEGVSYKRALVACTYHCG